MAPAAGPIGHLLRTAIDAEQVGAGRLHLPADQPELAVAFAALREQTALVLTCELPLPGADAISSGFVDAVVDDDADLPALVVEVARLEFLFLDRRGHRRAAWMRADGWRGCWLAP